MSHYFNDRIYDDMQTPYYTYPTVEITGFPLKIREEAMKDIFNRDQMFLLDRKLGNNIYFLSVFTE